MQTAAQRAWYIRHRAALIARATAYNRNHPGIHKRARQKWSRNNRVRETMTAHQWRASRPSFVNWQNMMNRCFNKNAKGYHRYGERGITVCHVWRTFSEYEREFGYLKPGRGYTVDRLDNNGNYEPGNVEWVTRSENTKRHLRRVACAR